MKNLLKLLIAVFAISMQAQVKSYDKLRVKELENKPQNSRVIVADENGNLNYKNQSEIQTDLTNYYTKPETNGLLNAKQNKLTAGSNVTITGSTISATDTKYSKGTAQDIQTGSNTEGKVWEAKVLADYINSSVWGGQWLSGSMELALVNKNRTVIEKIDLSSLATGDLQVTVDDTDPNNPVLVFKQNGVEVGRVPASAMLSGVARDATLNGMTLQFKDLSGTVVYEVSFAGLFNQKADKTTTITANNGLVGGGSLAANRTISLSAATSANINKGVEAHDWGDFRDYGLGSIGVSDSEIDNINGNLFFRSGSLNVFGNYGSGISLNRQFSDGGRIAQLHIATPPSGSEVSLKSRIKTGDGWSDVVELWHSGNLSNPATQTWVNSQNYLQELGTVENVGGYLSLSNSNNLNLTSLSSRVRQNSLERYNTISNIFTPYTTSAGSTGYPSSGGIGSGIRIERRSSATNQAGFDIWARGTTQSELYFKTFRGENDEGSWNEFWHSGNLENPATTAQLNTKENTLQVGTLQEILTGTNNTNKKWSPKVIADGIDRMIERELDVKSGTFTAYMLVAPPSAGFGVNIPNQKYYKQGRLVTIFFNTFITLPAGYQSDMPVILHDLPYRIDGTYYSPILVLTSEANTANNYFLYSSGEKEVQLFRITGTGSVAMEIGWFRSNRIQLTGQFTYMTNE